MYLDIYNTPRKKSTLLQAVEATIIRLGSQTITIENRESGRIERSHFRYKEHLEILSIDLNQLNKTTVTFDVRQRSLWSRIFERKAEQSLELAAGEKQQASSRHCVQLVSPCRRITGNYVGTVRAPTVRFTCTITYL